MTGVVKFGLRSSEESFNFQLPTHSKVEALGKSDSTFNFKAVVIIGVNAGS